MIIKSQLVDNEINQQIWNMINEKIRGKEIIDIRIFPSIYHQNKWNIYLLETE